MLLFMEILTVLGLTYMFFVGISAYRSHYKLFPPNSTHKKPYKNLHSNRYYEPEEIYTDKIKEYIRLGYIKETNKLAFIPYISLINGSLPVFLTEYCTINLHYTDNKYNKNVMKNIEERVEYLLKPKLKSITKNNSQLTCCATGDLLTIEEIKDSKWCNDCKIIISPNTLLLTNNKCPECNSRSLTKYKQ